MPEYVLTDEILPKLCRQCEGFGNGSYYNHGYGCGVLENFAQSYIDGGLIVKDLECPLFRNRK